MNQRVKRAIAAAMSLTMLATATPVSPLYNAIQNAVLMQASAAENKYIENYDNDTFSIASFDDLNMFAEAVNGGKTFENKTITLADNFNMGTKALTTPIGTAATPFKGTFDGNNKTIKLNIESAEDFAGLFGYVDGATIRNITVTGSAYCADVAGGICGFAAYSNIYNCANIAEVTGGSKAGGICGLAGDGLNVYSCTNNAAVKATDGTWGYAGGILGYADVYAFPSVYNCANIAPVTSEYGAGGICGYSYSSPLVHNCINIAAVSGKTDIGGICGGSDEDPYIINCYLLDVNNQFNENDVTEINAEQLKGTQKVDGKTLTVTELLNDYVDKFSRTDITLLEWEQGQDYPILKIPVPQDAYTKIDGTNLKWKLEDDGKLTISLIKTDETDTTKNAMPDWIFGKAPWNGKTITSVVIENGVTRISNCAFMGCKSLESITIPSGVTSIGNSAFRGCELLESITIPSDVTSIGDSAFMGCKSLESITIPSGVTSIGKWTFKSCELLESITIPSGVTRFYDDAFSGCTALTSIKFEGDVPEIKDDEEEEADAFGNVGETNPAILYYPKNNATWKDLLKDKSETFEWKGGTFKAEAYVPCNKIEGTNLQWTIDEGKLTIGLIKSDETDETLNAMPDWEPGNKPTPWENIKTSITSVEICDGVTHIGKCAFLGYNSVTEVTIGNDVTTIGNNAFNNTSIESVIIPDSVKSIGNMTFAFNDALKSVVLGNNVELIDQGAFISTGLTSIIIPAKVTKICYGAFSNDADLKEIVFKGNPPEIIYDGAIPAAFSGVGTQDNPVKLLYPKNDASWETFLNGKDEVFVWEDGKFKAEAYLNWNDIADTNLHWAISVNGTLYIEPKDKTATTDNAMPGWYGNIHSPWYNNTEITSVKIEDGVTNIGSDAFKGCSGLTSIAIPNSVTSFGDNAFNGCSELTSITIPSGVTEIGSSAFENFSGLTSITIPSGVTEIGDNAFMNCSALTSITIPASVTSISSGVFNGCSKLTEITIPSGVTSIEQDLFNGCSKLSSITIPSGVTTIGSYAFSGCSALTEVTIPSGVTSIGEWAFKGCELLESITLPSDVTSISSRTFEDCSALKEITIPSGVTRFNDNAFSGCTALTSIKFEGDVPEIKNNWEEEADAFDDVGKTTPAILYYPKGNATWEDLLKDKSEIFEWKGGTFKAEAYLNWNDIADTNLHWAISENGTLYIDKQENASGSNFTVPDFDDNAPWKDSISKINRVEIAKDVTNISTKSFKGFEAPTILVLENGYNGTKPTAFANSTYSSFGGGEFIYKTQAVGASLSLDGQIGVNISFYVNKNEGSAITINGETVDLAQLTSVNGVYTYTLWVAPKDAYNDITFKTVKGSDTIVEQTYSVKSQYVDVVLADTEHKKYNKRVFDMVTALDTYINSSRVYFGIETDSDKITEINSAIDKITVVIPSEIETPVFNETMYYGSSLILDSGVKVRHYIKIADGTDISKFKLAVNGNDITDAELTKSGIKSGSDDVYFFETDEFNPIDFDKKVSVTYDGTNVIDKYSVLSYIKLALNNETTKDTKLGTMCKALYNYYLEAGKY